MSGGPGPLRDSPRLCLCLAGATVAADLRPSRTAGPTSTWSSCAPTVSPTRRSPRLSRFPRRAGIPAILTARRRADGGEFAGPEADRRRLLSRLLGAGFDFVDLEEDLEAPDLEALAASRGTRVIRSLHDLSRSSRGPCPARARPGPIAARASPGCRDDPGHGGPGPAAPRLRRAGRRGQDRPGHGGLRLREPGAGREAGLAHLLLPGAGLLRRARPGRSPDPGHPVPLPRHRQGHGRVRGHRESRDALPVAAHPQQGPRRSRPECRLPPVPRGRPRRVLGSRRPRWTYAGSRSPRRGRRRSSRSWPGATPSWMPSGPATRSCG